MIGRLLKDLSNLPGWNTKRKIVVLESDDWGSIRMPSIKVYRNLKEKGLDISSGDNERYNSLDTLASTEDLESLFQILKKYTDWKGNHPVFTAMALTANPNFERIKNSAFREYHYEPITDTFNRYGLEGVFELWKQGEHERLFWPEFHGREHLNVGVWMGDLQSRSKSALSAFEQGFWGFRNSNSSNISYQAAFDLENQASLLSHMSIIQEGLLLFNDLHGRPATFFVPPNGAIHQRVIDYSIKQGIRFVSSPKIHREPQGNGRIKRRVRFLGMTEKQGATYITRNCFFEPSYQGKGFGVSDCLGHIESAFRFRKPAVISTHRVNYIGGLKTSNRMEGCAALDELLKNILKRWPEVEFMTSPELGNQIVNDKY